MSTKKTRMQQTMAQATIAVSAGRVAADVAVV
jgi:hypothetical protein